MEPIKINIEVNLGEATLTALKSVIGAQSIPTTTTIENTTQVAKSAPAPPPAPQPETTPAPVQVDDYDDLPPSDAPAPKKVMPTEEDARKAVKAARDRGVSAKVIKDLMKNTFGIAASVECPAERRQELIDELSKLAA